MTYLDKLRQIVKTVFRMSRFLTFIIAFFITSLVSAQNSNNIVEDSLFNVDTTSKEVQWDMAFSVKTQNYFRGLLTSKAPTLSTNVGAFWKNMLFGIYGGVGVDGGYQETDFILMYGTPKIYFFLEYYYNFTEGITDIPTPSGLFDFNKLTTRGLLDFNFNTNLGEKKHWSITSSTILFGRDTYVEERVIDQDTSMVRTDQRYSQYLELAYTWEIDNYKIQTHVGGAFSWFDFSGEHLYGKHPGFSNLGINLTRKFVINDDIQIPVKASFYMNTLAERAYLIVSLNLIQLSKL